ncbi:helix-turn-helix transcriptional regulator [Rhizobium leguminosarum]|uniref:helix-turn-helix transcriptional regulator n=1 Tax=Rhizobium leguminosarum TaxID=384 RepID=UPI00103092A5|nr:LuxR C-terminal-related transcriptional regulator [Rhizobium leguminosarum]TAX31374.1 DNA-binding protein [Rhizobium leguminosarum]TAY34134.1 DNA-binding protein [Rhizobium leguminosarum]
MQRRGRAVGDCAEDAAFSCSQADGVGVSFNDGKELLGAMAKLVGFDFYLLSVFTRGDRTAFIENRLISNWPQSLVGFYEAADLFYCSRLVTAMKRTILPIFCKEGSFAGSAANQENRRLNTLFQMHGLKNTFAFALHDADLKQYIFAFSGDCPMPMREQATGLLYGCMELLDKVSRNGNLEDGPSETLTRREIECLRWSAAGKSSDEIAIILDLSSHTVAGYLKSATRKLDSVNRMQAVARAFRYRLL